MPQSFAVLRKRAAKRLLVLAIALASVRPPELLFCETQPSLPSPAYVVHIPGLRVTAMSPDEKYLAAFVVQSPKGASSTGEVQVWDFHSGSLVQAHSLPNPEPQFKYTAPTTAIRYTSDGQLLTVYTGGGVLHVLRASGLEEVRTTQIHSSRNVTGFEVSPTDHRVAVRSAGDVRVYNLDSGEELRSWSINEFSHFKGSALPQGLPKLAGGLAWRRDGMVLAVSDADNHPCLSGGGTIHILDLASDKASKTFRVPLSPASIAFGTGNNLYVASNTCGGYFTHWRLDLPIFDSTSGQETGRIPAGRVGVRNSIAISANKQVLLAYADREKIRFQGFEFTEQIEEDQWQVWDLATGKLILTLPATVHHEKYSYPNFYSYDGLSSSGRFVCTSRGTDVWILSLPVGAK